MIEFIEGVFPGNVRAGFTTRQGGFSQAPFDSFNLALHVGDEAQTVLANRRLLADALPEVQWQWLNQVHGCAAVAAGHVLLPDADASFSDKKNQACAVMTADCLPILLSDDKGTKVAAIHAGWRGLCDGVIENTLQQFTGELIAYLGPAIGPAAFEVGEDVRQAFLANLCGSACDAAFVPTDKTGKYLCNLYQLARIRLQHQGVKKIVGGGFCSYQEKARFYSYRRDGKTGRMLSFIYIQESI